MNSLDKTLNDISLLNNYKNTPKMVLIDTNFAYFALKNKIDLFDGISKCLNSEFIICVTECILFELEKLGTRFRLALKLLRQEKIIKLGCLHLSSIVYADDCILNFIKNKNFFIVATCDKDLMRRVSKISETPVISIRKKKVNLIRY